MARYISRAPKKPKRSKVIIFLNVLIGILTAAVIITAVGYWSSHRNRYDDRKFGESTPDYNVEGG